MLSHRECSSRNAVAVGKAQANSGNSGRSERVEELVARILHVAVVPEGGDCSFVLDRVGPQVQLVILVQPVVQETDGADQGEHDGEADRDEGGVVGIYHLSRPT